ncbi:hypothetical protein FGG08_006370 [Glutinoglossum americanum]|uniref:Protein kinase domain-containing protein n=1 Tax=Glutinoglossum americanum TaxID=1670608 RepID=A0A9P8I7J5_9PEZI|nr:hypothetical protein FGG08_006370 [Glutinoglossum americanum]
MPNSTSAASMVVEWTSSNQDLGKTDYYLLNKRIAILCILLQSAGHLYFMTLPTCQGYIHWSRTQFALIYNIPPFADSQRDPCSLYSMLRPNKRSIRTEKGRQLRPSLEQRYALAAAFAKGVLSLLSPGRVHKALNNRNVMFFYETDSIEAVDFHRPRFLDFGAARREQPSERTIDVRSLEPPLRLRQHPELRQGTHRRFERRYDIYSAGIILFEIGMW